MNRLHRSDTTLDIPQPTRVTGPDDVAWEAEHDVVVVGFGGAGVSAALEAIDQGADVLALDRFSGGGATSISGGVVYAGGGTPYQRAAGIEDTAEDMYKYLKLEVGDAVKEETLKRFCDESIENLQWLEDNKATFGSTTPPEKTSYPSKEFFLYFSGNEAIKGYKEQAKTAMRGHRTKGKGMSGEVLFAALKESAIEKGVKIQNQTEVVGLVTNDANEVLGVEVRRLLPGTRAAKKHKRLTDIAHRLYLRLPDLAMKLKAKAETIELESGETQFIRARKGVILAAGGFIFNKAMVDKYRPEYRSGVTLGAGGCNGSGIRLGQSVGGAIGRMGQMSAWRFINPPKGWAQGIMFNRDGKRFCNEEVYGAKLGYEMCENNDGIAWVLVNKALFKKSLKEIAPGKAWFFQTVPSLMSMYLGSKKGKTLAELAQKIGVPAKSLIEAVTDYSQAARGEKEDDFGKSEKFLFDLTEGPWYAMDASLGSKTMPCPVITLGGLKVNEENGLVLNEQGEDIAGLYAAGRTAVGVASNLYVSGLSIADCVFSGRRAARHAVSLETAEQQSVNQEKEFVGEPG